MTLPPPAWGDADGDDTGLSPSAGALLKRAREAAGLHIAALAVALKVPVKKLEALEQDRIDLLPDAMFARALAGSVCRNLKVNPGPILQRLPRTSFRASSFHEQRPAVPFQLPGRRQRWPSAGPVPRSVWAPGLALIAAAGLIFYLPGIKSASLLVLQDVQSGLSSVLPAESVALSTQLPGLAEADFEPTAKVAPGLSINKVDLPAAMPDLSAIQLPGSVLKVVRGVDERAATAGAQAVLPSFVTTPTASPSAGAMLTVTANKESWVRVTDAKGAVLLSRLLVPGEVVQASGLLPLDAVVGRADVVRVEVRGRRLDLAPLSRNNVARFEVK